MTNRWTPGSFASTIVLVLSGFLTLSIGSAHAQNPNSVIRTFAFKMPLAQERPLVDFLDDASVAIIVNQLPDFSSSELVFKPDSEAGPNFNATSWAYAPAKHVVAGRGETPGTFVWLITEDTPAPPPIGSRTLTGPSSPLILEQTFYFVRKRSSGPFVNRWELVERDEADDAFIVVTAEFSR